MFYHYTTWTYGALPSENLLARIGIYAVAIFYTLSGMTLCRVYFDRLELNGPHLFQYVKKRVLRIFPLLWLATFGEIILSRTVPGFGKLMLNLTGLFGFVNWDAYIATGVWSIGNELVFYLLFPIFVLLAKKGLGFLVGLAVVVATCFCYFAFARLDPNLKLADQWHDYVNPLNQVGFFFAGFAIEILASRFSFPRNFGPLILLLWLLVFMLYPANGDLAHLVTGWNRVVFTCAGIMICVSFLVTHYTPPKLLQSALSALGNMSYSVYLLHPLVFSATGIMAHIIGRRGVNIPSVLVFSFAVLTSIFVSHLTYTKFEKFFIRLGKPKGG